MKHLVPPARAVCDSSSGGDRAATVPSAQHIGRYDEEQPREAHFDAFDSDKDRKVTAQEFAAWPHARGDADVLFAERDSDKDGILTRAEFCTPRR